MSLTITPCSSYHGHIDSCEIVNMPDGKSVFKIYFVSIVGRSTPERFEWSHCAMTKDDFIRKFKASSFEGIGFVTAFPHIAKVFRYAPQAEILQHVTAFNPKDGSAIPLDRGDGFTEFACLAEAILANDEFQAWAAAETVQQYLNYSSPAKEAAVNCNTKLKSYWDN